MLDSNPSAPDDDLVSPARGGAGPPTAGKAPFPRPARPPSPPPPPSRVGGRDRPHDRAIASARDGDSPHRGTGSVTASVHTPSLPSRRARSPARQSSAREDWRAGVVLRQGRRFGPRPARESRPTDAGSAVAPAPKRRRFASRDHRGSRVPRRGTRDGDRAERGQGLMTGASLFGATPRRCWRGAAPQGPKHPRPRRRIGSA